MIYFEYGGIKHGQNIGVNIFILQKLFVYLYNNFKL